MTKRISPSERLDISALNNEEIETLFEEAFERKVQDPKGVIRLSNWEVRVEKKEKGSVVVAVSIYSYAGETTRIQFHDKKAGKFIKGAEELIVEAPRDGKKAKFCLFDSVDVSSNDYILYYRSAK